MLFPLGKELLIVFVVVVDCYVSHLVHPDGNAYPSVLLATLTVNHSHRADEVKEVLT